MTSIPISSRSLESQFCNVSIAENYQCSQSSFLFGRHHSGPQSIMPCSNQFIPDMLNTNAYSPLSTGISKTARMVHMNEQQSSGPVYPVYSGHTGSLPLVSSTNNNNSTIPPHLRLSSTPTDSGGCTTPQRNNSILVKPDYHNYSISCNQLTQSSILSCAESDLQPCSLMNNSVSLKQLRVDFLSNIPTNHNNSNIFTTPTAAGTRVTIHSTTSTLYPSLLDVTSKNNNCTNSAVKHHHHNHKIYYLRG
ncbi:unnamed protein product [Heterobilharzia americana]|nr:unnamed protein product [Heterobilharzia americana]